MPEPAYDLDRMEIEEAGDGPGALAEAIHAHLDTSTGAVDVERVALGLDILKIERKPLTTFEGGIVTQPERTDGVILVNSLSEPERQRFTIAHELLHFLNDRHVQSDEGVHCRKTEIGSPPAEVRQGMARRMRQEAEANRFAIELLAPRPRFAPFLRKPADLGEVLRLSTRPQAQQGSDRAPLRRAASRRACRRVSAAGPLPVRRVSRRPPIAACLRRRPNTAASARACGPQHERPGRGGRRGLVARSSRREALRTDPPSARRFRDDASDGRSARGAGRLKNEPQSPVHKDGGVDAPLQWSL